jgi:uncharacterized protein (UPF0332 family)
VQSWKNVSWDCLQAAQMLRDKHPRSSISRAYYAAFSAAVSLIWKNRGMPSAGKRETPSHRDMPQLLEQLLRVNGVRIARECKTAMLVLYKDRLTADYQTRTGQSCDSDDAANALRRATFIMHYCGVSK